MGNTHTNLRVRTHSRGLSVQKEQREVKAELLLSLPQYSLCRTNLAIITLRPRICFLLFSPRIEPGVAFPNARIPPLSRQFSIDTPQIQALQYLK